MEVKGGTQAPPTAAPMSRITVPMTPNIGDKSTAQIVP
jgi:hypothetical protein